MSKTNEELIELAKKRSRAMPEFKMEHFVGNAQLTPYAKYRQFLLEIDSRKGTLDTLEYDLAKVKLEQELEREYLESSQSPAQKKLHELEIMQMDKRIWAKEQDIRQSKEELEAYMNVTRNLLDSEYAVLPDGTSLVDVIGNPELEEKLEHEYWIIRLAKQTALDMVAYGKAGVGNMDAILMLNQDDQIETLKLASDFYIRSEIRNQNILTYANERIQQGLLPQESITKQLQIESKIKDGEL